MNLASRLFLLSLAGFANTAVAANAYLPEARRLMQKLDYAAALHQLELARRVATDDVAEQKELLPLLAECQIAEGQLQRAEQTFAELLDRVPRFELDPEVSPKIARAFMAARARLYPEGFLRLTLAGASEQLAHGRLVDPFGRVRALRLYERRTADSGFEPRELTVGEDGRWTHLFQAPAAWYLEAVDETGAVVTRAGSPTLPYGMSRPVAVAVDPPAGPAVEQRWGGGRKLALVGAAVLTAAGLASGTLLHLQSQRLETASADAEWADHSMALNQTARDRAAAGNVLFATAAAASVAVVVVWAW